MRPRTQELMLKPGSLVAPHTDVFLVDASGSMFSKWEETMATLDAYVATIRAARLQSQIIVIRFQGSQHHEIVRNHRIEDWVPFSEDSLSHPNGGTPLYSAINQMGLMLRENPPAEGACSICVVTDGEASYGDSVSVEQARAVLDWCRGHDWSVTFMGCDFDNNRQARALGADSQNSLGVDRRLLKDAGKLLAEKRIRYAQSGGDMGFSDDEKKKFGGLLTGPSTGPST